MQKEATKSLHSLWETEYQRKGIPSSFREDPTKNLVSFISFLNQKNYQSKRALDIGCGRGRNAFYLAQLGLSVIGLELVDENVQKINEKAAIGQLQVKAFCPDVTTPWPICNEEMDIAIDIFCYKHITDKGRQKNYRKALYAALKPGGYYLLNLAADDDGFYGPLLRSSNNPSIKLIVDPHSHIASLLYNLEEITQEFSDDFQIIEATKITSQSPMYGVEYQRQVLHLIFQKTKN